MSSFYVFLNTADKTSGTNYDPHWQLLLQPTVITNYAISLVKIKFKNSVYPINASNNVVEFNGNVGTIAPGSYNGDEIADALETYFNSVDSGFTVAFDSITYTLSIHKATSFTIEKTSLSSIWDLLGISAGSGTTITSSMPITISGTDYVDLIVDLNTSSFSSTTGAAVLNRVNVEVPFGGIVFYEPPYSCEVIIHSSGLNEFSMRMRDDKGNSYVLPDNSHVALTLKIRPLP